ncbi:hypothetical protein LKO27_00635 [Tessaracoccus sp. OS52]|uniref:hypothetical protein n=1 Tax=Tessaracoccus sp. OS52 TaxID=2886691 RepID=UPI001D12C461|nr:hypothetical protein [Tessaracoccus sp. OS52]MCC2591937.1 hypothetical protein [Tessaracoccus sp. OS52]
MSETQISNLLRDAAPGAPLLPDLGDKVRKGHRRRRTMQAVAAGTGLVALGVPLAFQLGSVLNPSLDANPLPPVINPADPSRTPSPTQAPTTDEPTAAPTSPVGNPALLTPEVCFDAVGTTTETADATIPEGATRMWLCSGDQEPGIPTFGAPEPFVGNLDEIIRGVNTQPLAPLREYCGDGTDYVWDYTMVLEYPDREPFVISTASDPCAPVVHNAADGRGAADGFFTAARELIYGQRQEFDYSYAGNEEVCLEARSLMTQSLYDMVGGVVCGVEPEKDADKAHVVTRPLPDEIFRRIYQEATANATQAPAHGLPEFVQTIVLSSKHGDPMTLYRWADGGFYYREGVTWMAWHPSAGLQSDLAQLFEGTRTEPFGLEDQFVNVCMDPNQLTTAFPVQTFGRFGACVENDGVYSFMEAPTHLGAAWSDEIRDAGETIPSTREPEFTGHYLVVGDADGRFAQLYVASTGDLVWDTDELMVEGLRMKTTPSAELLLWMREVGINV